MATTTTATTADPFSAQGAPSSQAPGAGGAFTPSTVTSPAPIGVPRYAIVPAGTPGAVQDPNTGQWVVPYGVPQPLESWSSAQEEAGGRSLAGAATQMVAPRYYNGDEWGPASWSVDQRIQLQNTMAQAGLYGAPDSNGSFGYIPGVWDKASLAAYSSLLGQSNASGQDADTLLNQMLDTARKGGGPSRLAAPLVVTNPEEIKGVLYNVAPNVIGRELTPAETDAFVSQFQSSQASGRILARDKTGEPTQVNSPYSGSNQSTYEQMLREQHPVEASATSIGSQAAQFLSMFAKGPQAGLEASGGRPG